LAQSFFYSRCQAWLVSQWRGASVSAVLITTSMMNAYSRGADKAVALQQAMLLLMRDKRRAHPAFWAPFVVVGETRANRETGAQFRR
jgi:CHAT domain-containing protein